MATAEPTRFFVIPNFSHETLGVVVDRPPLNEITLEDGICAFFFVVLGIFSVFFGYRLYRLTFLIGGVYFGYILMYPILVGLGVSSEVALFAASLAVGLALGLVFLFFWKIGLFGVGCLAGYIFATFMLGFCHATALNTSPWNYVFTAICCVALGIVALFFKRIVVIVSTSALGAYFVFYGCDVLSAGATGFAATFDGVLSMKDDSDAGFSGATWGMLVGCLALAAVGVFCQLFLTGKHDYLGANSKTSPALKKNKDMDKAIAEMEARENS